MKNIIVDATLVVLFVMVAILLAFLATSYDDVYISNSTGECVKVVKPDGTLGSCENKPKKYNLIWVK